MKYEKSFKKVVAKKEVVSGNYGKTNLVDLIALKIEVMRADFDHLVVISFNYRIDSLEPLHQLGDRLSFLMDQCGEGYYDGHEQAVNDTHCSMFIYGRNAEYIYKRIEPVLFEVDWMDGATVCLQFGRGSDQVRSIDFVLEKI